MIVNIGRKEAAGQFENAFIFRFRIRELGGFGVLFEDRTMRNLFDINHNGRRVSVAVRGHGGRRTYIGAMRQLELGADPRRQAFLTGTNFPGKPFGAYVSLFARGLPLPPVENTEPPVPSPDAEASDTSSDLTARELRGGILKLRKTGGH